MHSNTSPIATYRDAMHVNRILTYMTDRVNIHYISQYLSLWLSLEYLINSSYFIHNFLWLVLPHVCTMSKKAVQAAKRYYEKKLADIMNQKPFNAYLKSKTKTKPPVGPLKTDNNTVSDNTEMSTILNNYFCSVFSIENTTNMPRAVTLDFMSPIRNVIFSRSR